MAQIVVPGGRASVQRQELRGAAARPPLEAPRRSIQREIIVAQIINENRPQPGLITSGVVSVAGFAQPNTNYIITADLGATDLADTTLTGVYELRLGFGGNPPETVWGPNDWQGGIRDRNNNLTPPSLQYSTGNVNLPTTAEVRYTFNKQLAGRLTVDITGEPVTANLVG
jgi:hypothetical protein